MRFLSLLSLVFLLGCQQPGSRNDATAQTVGVADAEQIVANLKYAFPGLRDRDVRVDSLESTEVDGLYRGLLVVEGGGEQPFFVTAHDTALYLLAAGPVPVGLSAEEVDEVMAEEVSSRQRDLAGMLENAPAKGPEDAPVTIVEFSDFQCPFCARAHNTLKTVLPDFAQEVRMVFAHYPLPNHPWAMPAAIASACAAQQSDEAFWALHDIYFEDQKGINTDNVMDRTRSFLLETDIDVPTWENCALDEESAAYASAVSVVQGNLRLGQELGVSGTPHFLINGESLSGAQPGQVFRQTIQRALE